MAQDIAALQVKLDLQMAEFQKGMNQATKSMSKMNASTKKVSKQLQTAGRSMASFVKGAVALAGVGFSVSFLKGVIETNSALAKSADAVGIGIESFQAYQFAAERAGVSASQFTSNMTAFVKRVGEAKAGTGPLVSGLKNLNTELLASVKASRNQNEAFNLIADAIKDAGTATEAAAIANAAFSRAGVGMVNLLRDGSKGLADMEKEARKLGIVIGEQLVRASERYDDQLLNIQRSIKATFGSAFLSTIQTTFDNAGGFITSFYGMVEKVWVNIAAGAKKNWAAVEASITEVLARLAIPLEKLARFGGRFSDTLKGFADDLPKVGDGFKKFNTEVERINQQTQQQVENIDKVVIATIQQGKAEVKLREEMAKTRAEMRARAEAMAFTEQAAEETTKGVEAQLTALEKFKKGVLDAETAQSQYADKMVILHDLFISGAISIETYHRELTSLESRFGTAGQAVKGMEESISGVNEQLQDVAEYGLGEMVDGIVKADQSFSEFARNFVSDISRMIAKMQIFNALQGAFGGTGSSIFGGGKMAGGHVIGGRQYVVGERGPELFTAPAGGGSITPSGGEVEVNIFNNTSATASVNETKVAGGGKRIDVLIEQSLKKSIVRGSMDRTLKSIYGIQRRGN